jgi:DNA polymerase III subunit epsilon
VIGRFFRSRQRLTPQQEALLAAHVRQPDADLASPIASARFVVVDVESSGLDPHGDRLLSIGAVGVERSLIALRDSFYVTLRQSEPSEAANILVHGIDGTTQTSGCEADAALAAWLCFARKSPRVAFHASFDRVMLARAEQTHLHIVPRVLWLDLAVLAPIYFPRHAALDTLDAWLDAFGITNAKRHDALADATATAQLLQVILSVARREGHTRLHELVSMSRNRRWLGVR